MSKSGSGGLGSRRDPYKIVAEDSIVAEEGKLQDGEQDVDGAAVVKPRRSCIGGRPSFWWRN